MKFRNFLEFASFDFTPALLRIEKYMQEIKAKEKTIDHPLYLYSKQKLSQHDKVLDSYWRALTELKQTIHQHLNDANILQFLTPVYKKWQSKFSEMSNDEDAREIIENGNFTTHLYLVHEIVENILAGKTPEPD